MFDMIVFNSGELMENFEFTLADFEVKMVSWYWVRDCDSLTSVGNVSPKLKEMKTSKYISVVANHYQ